jgi:hypothetical protein
MLRSASVDANQSATPGYSTLIDPFALGAPKPEVLNAMAAEKPLDKSVDKPQAATGLRHQLQRFAKDRALSARPITRATVSG